MRADIARILLAGGMVSAVLLGGLPQSAQAQTAHRVGMLVRTIDQQFFTTPYERSAALGGAYMGAPGSAASVIRNPAALTSICATDIEGYWVTESFAGEVGITETPSDTAQDTNGFLNDEGVYVGLPLGDFPVSFGVGGDYFSTSFSEVTGPAPAQDGTRLSMAAAVPFLAGTSIGYGLTWFNDYYATAGWRDLSTSPTPYRLTNTSHSWRHRFALSGCLGCRVRWGAQFDYGYGQGTSRFDDDDPVSGPNSFLLQGGRGGFQWDAAERLTVAVDFEYSYMELNLGTQDPTMTGYSGDLAWITDTYRPMVGLQLAVTQCTAMNVGYRYTIYNLRNFNDTTRDGDYSTISAGVRHSFFGGNAMLAWTIEKSWIAEDELQNVVSINAVY